MANISTVLALGLVFHLVFIWCVFDCYFTSPVVHGMRHFKAGDGKAERLVLFVADGLRADLLFNVDPFPSIPDSPRIVAPYLLDTAKTRGAFGVSHTRVPTESRPGHVAIIAGMYEDVSAVTKGWKYNPVDFDSVFNQSRNTFSFGSPDILPMFARGAEPGRVRMWSYDEDDEDFTKDATELDVWVLDRLRELFANSSSDVTLNTNLRNSNNIFFLHLLGLDTTGHSYRPHSKEYMKNIQVVDGIVEETEKLFNEFFEDQKTSFIFTADHGMSNIGNHGDGNPDSTRTPLIAWGSGIRGPLRDHDSKSHDDFSATWGDDMNALLRQDVEQADIAPLMSALLGSDFAANSVGVLPDIRSSGYLDFSSVTGKEKRARLSLANAQVILEQYMVKHSMVERKLSFIDCHSRISDEGCSPDSQSLLKIQDLLDAGRWDDARQASAHLINDTIRGLRYLQTYDRLLLASIAVFAYLGWSAFSATSLLLEESAFPRVSKRFTVITNLLSANCLLSFWGLFFRQKEPWTYYLYVTFPLYFWRTVALRSWEPLKWLFGYSDEKRARKPARRGAKFLIPLWELSFLKVVIASFIALEAMVMAYTHRWIWSLGFLVIGLGWPLTLWPRAFASQNKSLLAKWAAACLATAIFPLRDVEQNESIWNVAVGGLVLIGGGFGWALLDTYKINAQQKPKVRAPILQQLILTATTTVITIDSVRRLQAKSGLPLKNQILGWVSSAVVIPMSTKFGNLPTAAKLQTLFLTFAPCFVILSINAEGLFYAAYCTTLILWIEVESSVRSASKVSTETKTKIEGNTTVGNQVRKYRPRLDDVRVALFFLFFVQVAFFGTGNVASISSFYLEPVYRLVPIFNPFLMASLLLFKIFAPYVVLAAVFAELNAKLELPPFSLFLIALSLTDVMTITFFFKVTDTGSWLEIGQTISFFVIASLLLAWSAGICALGEWLMKPGASPKASKKME
ncbi:PigN-domain-containing protein [Schizopora paradoxa]|uniref:GPI ethanolamine phosphate transferase 1 n=1 Tax=Schizopora paradoxa TaxID=27342 RepID=A0A0H2SQ69_9AGAM|nr:PigN-domain-containing protein [Schizopora paradoxa]